MNYNKFVLIMEYGKISFSEEVAKHYFETKIIPRRIRDVEGMQ